MANWLKSKDTNQFQIHIPCFKVDNYYAEFEIKVGCLNSIEWKIYRRYSEFKKLYDSIVKTDEKYKAFFPPKKSFNSMLTVFLNSRRKSLEMYLNEILSMCNPYMPRCLAYFLEMDKYEIHGITTAMAKTFFTYGNTVLKNNHLFEISVLHIHSINQRMSSPVPTNLYQRSDEDFGNVLDVIESLKKVKIVPNTVHVCSEDNCYGTSNIKLTSLTYDLSIFASVTDLQLDSLEISNLRGLYKMNNTVEKLRVNFCLKSIDELLLADFAYKVLSIDYLEKFDGPLRCATDVDFSHNSIMSIDVSIVTLRQVQILNLSHNHISDIEHMHHLIYLTELDLSYNNLNLCQSNSLSSKLGSVKKLLLRGNKLTSLTIVDRMFSLEYLDVSDNLLSDTLSLLSLCRLSCLESLIIKDNPICSQPDFMLVIYDLLLERYQNVQINGISYENVPLNVRMDIADHRASMKSSIPFEPSFLSTGQDASFEHHTTRTKRTKLSTIEFFVDENDPEKISSDTILSNTNVFNIFIYWFYLATDKFINPKKLLWVTEIFAPNQSIRPLPMLLATSGTNVPNVLKCRLSKSFDAASKRYLITIQPKDFLDLTSDCQHMIIGADKFFLRLDIASNNRSLYLCNNPSAVDAFICHLYHVDDGMASYGDSRIVHLNEEDRMEMMRRFVDVWRLDLVMMMKRSIDNVDINIDTESEFMFTSRAMLQMKNGFQIVLTVVVTKEIIYLVDERIYDWPDFNKNPSLSDLSSGNSCSPYTSSCGQFPFLRTNAFLLSHVEHCSEVPISSDSDSIIERLCPVFRYPVQITFNAHNQSIKDPLKLLFENDKKTRQLCHIIYQQCENLSPSLTSFPSIVTAPVVSKPSQADIPCHLRHIQSSYSEIRLCLSLSHPKLLNLAQSQPEQVLSFVQDTVLHSRDTKVYGMFWTKFIYLNFESDERTARMNETPGLVCLSSSGLFVVHEMEEESSCEIECSSDPEADQHETSGQITRLETLSIDRSSVFKTCVGLNHQWLTFCCRVGEGKSEWARLVLIVRNKDMCKHVIGWIDSIVKDAGENGGDVVEYGHQASDTKELLFQIQRAAGGTDIDLVHYCSLEDVRFDPAMACQSTCSSCDDVFSLAIVVTTTNIAIIRHNIGEYPVRDFAPGTIRESPRHLQYQVLTVIPLFDCLHLQLPGHDRSVLIIVIRSNDTSVPYRGSLKLQLSISCQKEQKRLIDKLRHQRSQCLQIDAPLRVSVC